jgi:hypothetical protein
MLWIFGAVSMVMLLLWVLGYRYKWVASLGLLSHLLLLIFFIRMEKWGLVPANIAFVIVHTKNWIKASSKDITNG